MNKVNHVSFGRTTLRSSQSCATTHHRYRSDRKSLGFQDVPAGDGSDARLASSEIIIFAPLMHDGTHGASWAAMMRRECAWCFFLESAVLLSACSCVPLVHHEYSYAALQCQSRVTFAFDSLRIPGGSSDPHRSVAFAWVA